MAIRERGLFLTQGHGPRPWDLEPALDAEVRRVYVDAKKSIWAELPEAFIAAVPQVVPIHTRSANREDYILHPESGERLTIESIDALKALREVTTAGTTRRLWCRTGLTR